MIELLNLSSDVERKFDVEANINNGGEEWISQGDKDDKPQYIDDLYNNSTTHNSLTRSIIDMILGDGFNGVEDMNNEFQGVTLYERLYAACVSLKKNGGVYLSVIPLTGGGYDFTVGKYDWYRCAPKTEVSPNIFEVSDFYFSKNFRNPYAENKPKQIKKYKEGIREESILFIQMPLGDKQYYADPDYWGARRYIELEQLISEYHVNELVKGFMPSGMLSILSGVEEDPEKRKTAKNKMDQKLAGVSNAGKIVYEWANGADQAMKWTPFITEDLQDRYVFLAEECTQKIMIGHRVVNPIAFGVPTGTGFSNNADETETSLEVFKERIVSKYRDTLINGLQKLIPTISEVTSEVLSDQQGVKLSRELDSIALGSDAVEDYQLLIEGDVEDTPREDGYYLKDLVPLFKVRDEKETWLQRVFAVKEKEIYSDPNKRDSRDFGLYKVLYKYDHPKPIKNTRNFCFHMYEEHSETLFRRDDIDQMSRKSVNEEFGRYDIFKFKGSYNCRGRWKRQVYFLKRVPTGKEIIIDGVTYKGGQFLPTNMLDHFRRVGNVWNPNNMVRKEDREAGTNKTQQV